MILRQNLLLHDLNMIQLKWALSTPKLPTCCPTSSGECQGLRGLCSRSGDRLFAAKWHIVLSLLRSASQHSGQHLWVMKYTPLKSQQMRWPMMSWAASRRTVGPANFLIASRKGKDNRSEWLLQLTQW
jgi:hypothetical protein